MYEIKTVRIRLMAGKPITRDIFRAFLTFITSSEKGNHIKLFNVVGYPTETVEEWAEFIEDIAMVDAHVPSGPYWNITLHTTPFRALPATPAACWPMSYHDYRKEIAARMKIFSGHSETGLFFFKGKRFMVQESMNTEGLASTALAALCIRATEKDAAKLEIVATSEAFAKMSGAQKLNQLEKGFDMKSIFGAYTPETLPTHNIRTYINVEKHWGISP